MEIKYAKTVAKVLNLMLEWLDVDGDNGLCNLLIVLQTDKALITIHERKLAREYLTENLPEREFIHPDCDACCYSWPLEDIEARRQWLEENILILKNINDENI